MEVMIPPSNFNSASTSPYATAPSSPHRFPTATGTFFYSVPTSPNSSIFGDAEEELDDGDFAFDFGTQIDTKSLTADELFDGGKIKPLKPPPRFLYDQSKSIESPKSPARTFREAFSPRYMKNDFDPFTAALEQTRRESVRRQRSNKTSSTKKGSSRSLSPLRVSNLLLDPDSPASSKSSFSSSLASIFNKKWKIKDLLLFRSASESRTKDDELMKKHTIVRNARLEEMKSSSFHSTCSSASVSPTSSRRKSAHEVHYTVNRAVSEEMKKRTSLPYKQTLFSCLGFNPSLNQLSGITRSSTGYN